jgi:hypothetical protein
MFDKPNEFYFRCRPPGDVRRHGSWSDAEKETFLARLQHFHDDFDVDVPPWGLFAAGIPGRVGSQCKTFYF